MIMMKAQILRIACNPEPLGREAATGALIFVPRLSSSSLAELLIGQASVIDGDTLEIHSTRIRLWGIYASESTQLCRGGAKAANDLDAFIARHPCVDIDQRSFKRGCCLQRRWR